MSINRQGFFDRCRKLFHGSYSKSQQSGLENILDEWERRALSKDIRWLAYILATAYHETAATMQPVKEAYWLSEEWRKTHLRYYPYYGRGYVQLTWKAGYEKAGRYVKDDLVTKPDLALRPDYAADIAFAGMTEGWFRSDSSGEPHTLGRYFGASVDDAVGARAIVNGRETKVVGGKIVTVASIIAGYHSVFLSGLNPQLLAEDFDNSVVLEEIQDQNFTNAFAVESVAKFDKLSFDALSPTASSDATQTLASTQIESMIERALSNIVTTAKDLSLPDNKPYFFPNGIEHISIDVGIGTENKLNITVSGTVPKT